VGVRSIAWLGFAWIGNEFTGENASKAAKDREQKWTALCRPPVKAERHKKREKENAEAD
jgi:hypothetical protein